MDDTLDLNNVDDVLAHYGVKGMRWGVRKASAGSRKGSGAVHPVTPHRDAANPSHSSSSGSSGSHKKSHEQSDDDIIYQALRNKARKEGIHTLSNDEVRVLTARHDLVTRFHNQNPPPPKNPVVEFFVKDLLVGTGKKTLQAIAQEVVTKKAVKKFAP